MQPAGAFAARRSRYTQQSIKLYAVLLDCIVTLGASLLGQVCYGFITATPTQDLAVAAGVGALSSLVYVLLANARGHYRLSVLTQPLRHMRRAWTLVLMVGLLLTAILFLLKTGANFSRGAILLFLCLQFAGLSVAHILQGRSLRRRLVRGDIDGMPVVLIGDQQELAGLSAATLLLQFGFREVTRISFARDHGADDCDLRRAIELARTYDAAGFCLALDWGDQARIATIGTALRASPLSAKLIPDRRIRSVLGRGLRETIAPNLVIEVQRAPLTRAERAVKRTFDIVLAAAILVAIAPFMVAVACAIKLDSAGPVIFRQRRKGLDQHAFLIYKFRSMRVMEDGDTIRQASRFDGRVTRIGRLMRRTSIDELPQLFNVLARRDVACRAASARARA